MLFGSMLYAVNTVYGVLEVLYEVLDQNFSSAIDPVKLIVLDVRSKAECMTECINISCAGFQITGKFVLMHIIALCSSLMRAQDIIK